MPQKPIKRVLGKLTWVELALLIIAVGALAVELIALKTDPRLLISVTMRHDGRRWGWEPFLFGLLTGHFYCPTIPWKKFGLAGRPRWFPLIWILPAAGLLSRDLIVGTWLSLGWCFAIALGAIALGAITWNQATD